SNSPTRGYSSRPRWPRSCAEPTAGRAATVGLLNHAALGNRAVDVLDRAVQPVDLRIAIGTVLAARVHGPCPHHRKELRAVGGALLVAAALGETFQAGHALVHSGGGGGQVALAAGGIDIAGARRHRIEQGERQHGHQRQGAADTSHRTISRISVFTTHGGAREVHALWPFSSICLPVAPGCRTGG